MIDNNYIVYENGVDIEEQREQMLLLFNRVGKITPILYSDKPTQLPFKISFPILDILEQAVFLKECQKHLLFEDLPEHYKKKIYLAEKVNFFNSKFLEYLKNQKIKERDFSKKDLKEKSNILYDFLFSNHLDIGILN